MRISRRVTGLVGILDLGRCEGIGRRMDGWDLNEKVDFS